jgi:hypothetical protein
MGNNLYNDFSDDAPQEFKTKFIRVHRYYVVYSRVASCFNSISSLYPLCAGTAQQIFASYQNKYISDVLSISIPILVVSFLIMFGLVLKCTKFQKTDVDTLLKYTQYFKVVPDIDMEEQVGVNTTKGISNTAFKLLQFKYH